MLNTYLSRTRRLLQNPSAPVLLYSTPDLTDDINQARGQVAGESRSIRRFGALTTAVGQRNYAFSSITGLGAGVAGAIHVRAMMYDVADGQAWIRPRPWPWFMLYALNNPVPLLSSQPKVWSQFGQGVDGIFYLDPIPVSGINLVMDCVCYPSNLTVDADPEPIPYLWTDAVPYFAAYLALLSAQAGARQADANRMFERYSEFITRARQFANPDVNSFLYDQSPDPAMANKFGPPPGQGGGR